MYPVAERENQRYIGEMDRSIVHDTWHSDCGECLVEEIIERGVAVSFEPDRLDQALWGGFGYCENCFDGTEPLPPHRSVSSRARAGG
jgi:hypothetical protein